MIKFSIIIYRQLLTASQKLRKEQSAIGGGNASCTPLNKLEVKLFSLMGKTAIEGDAGVPELGLAPEDNS